jgi:hypothetical protein
MTARRAEAVPPHVYRNLLPLLGRGGLLFVAGGLIIISMLFYVTHLPHYKNGADIAYGTAAAFFIAGLVACVLAVRTLRSAIIVGPEGVIVRRAIHLTQSIPWPQVKKFDVVAAPRFMNRFTRTPVAVAVLRTGRPPLYCLGSSFSEPSAEADAMADNLNEIQASWFKGLPDPADR